jgi:hypothetical protein
VFIYKYNLILQLFNLNFIYKRHKENRSDLPPLKQNARNRVDVDKDEGGIFKARNNNRDNNAKTIPDSHDMYIDKPVDYRNAKPVIQVILTFKFQLFI